jgi:hypothetical protein
LACFLIVPSSRPSTHTLVFLVLSYSFYIKIRERQLRTKTVDRRKAKHRINPLVIINQLM